ncbi:MAG: penicillin-binding protein 2 [Actinomycetota bacterium]|nr:penicillin-binding protein 2 [Actinomycetota bacterium]
MTADSPRLRLAIVGIVALSLFAALFARLWFLQVLAAPEYKLAAKANQVRVVSEPAPRGRILDRNGKVLVDNRASNVVALDRSKVRNKKDRDALLTRLAVVLGVTPDVLHKRYDDQRVSPYTPVPIALDVPENVLVLLRERRSEFPAVVAKRVAMRTYPNGALAAHVLGYVGEINQDELDAHAGQYQLGDTIGKAGVERVYEDDLRGRSGQERIEVDADGVPIRVLSRRPPVQGSDVVLSLDIDVQRVTEDALAQGLLAARGRKFEENGKTIGLLRADAGAAVVLDAKEGTVVAMASYPTFDPSQLVNGISNAQAAMLFGDSSGAPFTNRAIQGQYAPGSTWKLVTANAAVRTGMITPGYSIDDTGTYTLPGDCTGRACIRRNAGSRAFGRVDLRRALTVSSDVYFYNLGAQLWSNRAKYGETPMQDVAAMLGFGSVTGVPLPSETRARLASPALRAQLHKEKPKVFIEGNWFAGDNVSLAIGQGELTVTPIQLANAYATFANNGTRFSPNIALRVQSQTGQVQRQLAPRVAGHVDIPSPLRDTIMAGFTGAVSDPAGTAYNAFQGFPLGQYPIAGKTGTAQAPPKQDTALFVGMAPVSDPRYVTAVVMEQSGFGASAAAPVARRIFGQLSGLEPGGTATYVGLNGVGD